MAGIWIPLYASLRCHPKTKRLAKLLDKSIVEIVGHLALFWTWVAHYGDGGDVTAFDDLELADGAEWVGDAHLFVESIVRAGFVDQYDGRKAVHDWPDFFGKAEEARRKNAEKQGRYRAKTRQTSSPAEKRNGYVTVTTQLRYPQEEKLDKQAKKKKEETRTPADATHLPAELDAASKRFLNKQFRKQFFNASNDPTEQVAILGNAFNKVFGVPANHPRLAELEKQAGSGDRLLDLMFSPDGMSDEHEPIDWLAARVGSSVDASTPEGA